MARVPAIVVLCIMCLASTCRADEPAAETTGLFWGGFVRCSAASPCPADQTCYLGHCKCPLGTRLDTATQTCLCGNVACNGAGGEICRTGVCQCPTGITACGNTCVRLATDARNCGACNNICDPGLVCRAGACACPFPSTLVGGVCVCGGTAACRDDQVCTVLGCRCPAGTQDVNGVCVCGLFAQVPCPLPSRCVVGVCRA